MRGEHPRDQPQDRHVRLVGLRQRRRREGRGHGGAGGRVRVDRLDPLRGGAEDGAILFQFQDTSFHWFFSPAMVSGGALYIGNSDGKLFKFTPEGE